MENLMKQTRARFTSGQPENKYESNEMVGRKITSESQSSGETKRGQSWIRRQFSRQKSSKYERNSNYEYQIAVAAAACAIQSLEEMRSDDKDKNRATSKADPKSSNKSKKEDGVNPPQTPKSVLKSSNKSKKEDGVNPPLTPKSAVKSSDEYSKKSFKKDADSIKVPLNIQKMLVKKPSYKKNKQNISDTADQHQEVVIQRPLDHRRPIIRPSTSANRHLNISEDIKSKTPDTKPYYRPPTPLPRAQDQPVIEAIRQSARNSRLADSKADAWEKQELARLKERYEKTRATIDGWENKRKELAKRKIGKIEAELYKKRVKSTQSHQLDIKVIEGIADGARKQAAENRRNQEFNIEDKTNKIRATGKLPHSSFCC